MLWAHIDVRSSQNDSLATLAVFLKLSRAVQIDLSIWNDLGDKWDGISSLLLPHQQRIRTVNVKQEHIITRKLHFSIASKTVQSLRHLPALTTIKFVGTLRLGDEEFEEISGYSDGWVFDNLQVSLSKIPKESNILASLGHITTMDTPGDLGPKFAAMQNLTKICLHTSPKAKDTVPVMGVPPRLFSLTGPWHSPESLFLLIDSVINTLQILTLRIASSQWRQLVGCLVKATKLKELNIYLGRATTEKTDGKRIVELSPVRSLETLSVEGDWWAVSAQSQGNFDEVIDDCAALYPGIRSFTLFYNFHSNLRAVRAFLENLNSLEYLRLRGRPVDGVGQVIPIKLPALRRLEALHMLLPYISAPNLEWFSVTAGKGLETPRFGSILGAHIRIDPDEFYNLERLHHLYYPELAHLTLELTVVSPVFGVPLLRSLRGVIIKSEELLDQNATNFCLSMLYFPDSCSLLEEVELSGFVEWDILVLMLERRNFIPTGVERIHTLRLPLRPPHLENVISSLLDGKFTERPPNEDLSTEGIREVLCSAEVYASLSPPVPLHINTLNG